MKRYRITVNGKTFEVDVEETGSQKQTSAVPVAPAPSTPAPVTTPAVPAPSAKPVVAKAPAPSTPAPKAAPAQSGAMTMKSPLPGKILKVMAAAGSSWKKGDTLLVIEAMKMENEILAPRDCTVEEVLVEANQTVKTGDALLKIV
ncbi:MAG: biotin/lipoyl-containing protein [Candidatus Cryosericum sp.]